LKKLDPTTFSITNIPNTISFQASEGLPAYGLAFGGSNKAEVTNLYDNGFTQGHVYRVLTLSSGSWSETYRSINFFAGDPSASAEHGLAYDSASATLYSVNGFKEFDGTSHTSTLDSIDSPFDGSGTKTIIGTITGYPGMVGITMAPATGSISSPTPPAGAKDWEPVREIILD
jgi:hypothetical protein